jgi:hypothetical protein
MQLLFQESEFERNETKVKKLKKNKLINFLKKKNDKDYAKKVEEKLNKNNVISQNLVKKKKIK